jgi:hypothetical protein
VSQAEYTGARLVMLIRRQRDQEQELERTKAEVDTLLADIYAMDPGALYQSTGEIPVVSSSPVSPAAAVTERFERVRNLDPIPYRADRTDGGNTFRLTPIGDTVVNMPAVRPGEAEVPMIRCQLCQETFPHVHGEGGRIHAQTPE